MKIYLDFDATCVEHEYPKIGRCNFGCIEVLKKLQEARHEIVLNTYRADLDAEENNGTLKAALNWINGPHRLFNYALSERYTFKLEPIEALPNKIFPTTWDWLFIKQEQVMFIDDQAYRIPLKPCYTMDGDMVNWHELNIQFVEHGLYKY